MKHIAIVVDWYGPYSDRAKASLAELDFGPGLYIALGKCAYERSRRLQYIGISRNLTARLAGSHPKLELVTREPEYWLGEVGSVGIPGKKSQGYRSTPRFGGMGPQLLLEDATERPQEDTSRSPSHGSQPVVAR